MNDDTRKQLAAEYEELQEREKELLEEWNSIDEQMKKIESELPDADLYPDDPANENIPPE